MHAEMIIAACAAGIPGSWEKLGTQKNWKNLTGLHGLEDGLSRKIARFLCIAVKHFGIIKEQIFGG